MDYFKYGIEELRTKKSSELLRALVSARNPAFREKWFSTPLYTDYVLPYIDDDGTVTQEQLEESLRFVCNKEFLMRDRRYPGMTTVIVLTVYRWIYYIVATLAGFVAGMSAYDMMSR